MRASFLLACSALALVACDRRGYASYPQGYSPPTTQGAGAWSAAPGWGSDSGPQASVPAAQPSWGQPSTVPGWGSYPGPHAAGWSGAASPPAGWSGSPQGWGSPGGWQAPSPRPPVPAGPAGAHAAQVAMSFHGRPYCWGGAGPDCFDCSGLTSAAWRAAGRAIPRTSDEQREKLAAVAMSELQPGDVLWRPGHVGMYVGNGWAIHAPGTGKVVQYQPASKFVEARRPQ